MQTQPADRIFKSALVRKSNKIQKIAYYDLDGHVYVDDDGNDVSILQATIGSQKTSSDHKREFIQNDPDLIYVGDHWTCGGCRRTAYRSPIQHDTLRRWVTHKLKCSFIQNKLRREISRSAAAAQGTKATSKARRTLFKEERSGTIRQTSYVGGTNSSPESADVRARRAVLENSALAGTVEPRRVFCLGCDEWIHLSSRAYNAHNWEMHLEAHIGWGLRQDPTNGKGSRQRSTSPAMRSTMCRPAQTRKTSRHPPPIARKKTAGENDAHPDRHAGSLLPDTRKSTPESSFLLRAGADETTLRSTSPYLLPEPVLLNEDSSGSLFPTSTAGTPREEILELAAHEEEEFRARERIIQPADEAVDPVARNIGQDIVGLEARAAGAECAVQKVEFSVPPGVTRMALSIQLIRS